MADLKQIKVGNTTYNIEPYTSYLPLTGGTVTGELIMSANRLWIQGGSTAGSNSNRLTTSSGMPGDMQYNNGKRGLQLYSNGIALADPYNGNANNDSAWIRHLETTVNAGLLEIAAGDDASNEEIRFRYYNTGNNIAHDILVPKKTGTIALTSDIPSNYVTTNTDQTITGYKKISSIGIDTINGATLGNAIMRQNTSTGDVILGSTVRSLRLWGNGDRPTYSKDDGASYKNLALLSDLNGYLPLGGGTLTGALNFNNSTWNLVGDDVYIGDYDQAGSLGIRGKNGQTNIGFVNQSNNYYIKLASPGVTENRIITMPNDSGTMALTKDVVPKNHNSRFYPYIGSAYRKSNYKVTLPISGYTDSNNCWMMITMELILGGSYNSGANGTIFLSYYFLKDSSNYWHADQVRAIGIGNKLADNEVRIQYDISNPGVFYVHSNNNEYNSFSIQNLTANDTAPNFDFTKTTIEPVDSIPSGLAVVPLTCLDSKGDNKLYVNNTAVSLDGHTHSSVADIGNSATTTFAYSKSGLNYNDYTWLAGWNGYELRAVNKSQFATSGHTHSNYVTTDTTQTISGAKTFSNTITANNWLYVPYIGTKTNKLYIEGPWSQNGQEQPTLSFEDGALKAYNWQDDGDSVYESTFYFNFPYGVRMDASGASMYLNGNNGCYLQSTSNGWQLAQNDNLGSIYANGNNYGRVGTKDHHFYQGFINNIYANQIYPSSGGVGSTGNYNVGCVGDSGTYFKTGAFKTVYRTSESGLSDIRSKQNISNNDLNALEIINNLSIINFQYDDDIKAEARNKKQRLKAIKTMQELPKTKETKELRKELQKIIATPNNEDMITIGVSAQQLQELLPKKYQKTFIQKESTNQYADQLFIRENRLVYLSFKAIQEQQAIIGSLEEKINLLEEKINTLEEKMKKEVN